jgi:hypothetical protein
MPCLNVTTFTVRASQEQARRWARVARWLRCRSVSSWLEEMADEACRRLQEAVADATRRTGGKLPNMLRVRILRKPNPHGSAYPEYQLSSLKSPNDPPTFASPANLLKRAEVMGASALELSDLEERAANLEVGESLDLEG